MTRFHLSHWFYRATLPWRRKSSPSDAARTLANIGHVNRRNHVIDTANELRARMGMPPIPRRTA